MFGILLACWIHLLWYSGILLIMSSIFNSFYIYSFLLWYIIVFFFLFLSSPSHLLQYKGIIILGAKIFRLQKNIIRIMLGCRSGDLCRKLFMKLKVLPIHPSIFVLFLFLWSTVLKVLKFFLRKFWYEKSFYSLQEYFQVHDIQN